MRTSVRARQARLFDLDTGSTVDSYPALGADGTLFVGSANGRLYALAEATQSQP